MQRLALAAIAATILALAAPAFAGDGDGCCTNGEHKSPSFRDGPPSGQGAAKPGESGYDWGDNPISRMFNVVAAFKQFYQKPLPTDTKHWLEHLSRHSDATVNPLYENLNRPTWTGSDGKGSSAPHVGCGSGCFGVDHPRAQFAPGPLPQGDEVQMVTLVELAADVDVEGVPIPSVPYFHAYYPQTPRYTFGELARALGLND